MKIEGQTATGIDKVMPAVGHPQYLNRTGAAVIAEAINPGTNWRFEGLRVHLSAAGGAGDFTATIDHHKGAAFDFNILTEDMTTTIDLIYAPARPMEFREGDKLVIAYANANTRTYGLEVVWKEI